MNRLAVSAAVVLAVLGSASLVRADDDATPQTPAAPIERPASRPSSPDFFIGPPRAWLTFRGSYLVPRAGGDLFAFVTEQLTLSRSDFRSRGFSSELGIVIAPRVDIVGGFDMARHAASSEYRRFIGSNGQPITQDTHLEQSAVSAGIRVSPVGRGQRISRFAFIPRRVSPYAGAGMTMEYYQFWQQGRFVDYVDRSVFIDRFASDGWGFGPYVTAGAEVQVWKRLFVNLDGRYSWIHSGVDTDFNGFNSIDLAGFRGGTGMTVLF
jgi:hypothetical protein